jgi:hypothetical protein
MLRSGSIVVLLILILPILAYGQNSPARTLTTDDFTVKKDEPEKPKSTAAPVKTQEETLAEYQALEKAYPNWKLIDNLDDSFAKMNDAKLEIRKRVAKSGNTLVGVEVHDSTHKVLCLLDQDLLQDLDRSLKELDANTSLTSERLKDLYGAQITFGAGRDSNSIHCTFIGSLDLGNSAIVGLNLDRAGMKSLRDAIAKALAK